MSAYINLEEPVAKIVSVGSVAPRIVPGEAVLVAPVAPRTKQIWSAIPTVKPTSSYLPENVFPVREVSQTDAQYNPQRVYGLSRPTTDQEMIMGEIWGFSLLEADWDGEGALKPSLQSMQDAVSFVMLMDAHVSLPEPVLHVSGNVALFWDHGDALYADIEFLGDNSVAYFIKTNQDRHKGVVSFDSEQIPAVFKAVLVA